jgi:hypothetical protein
MDTAAPPAARHDRKTERRLDRLPASFLTLREVRVPGRAEAIDYLVLGATGAFAVTTRSFAADVVLRGADARCDGRSLEPFIEAVRTQALALRPVLQVEVQPIVVVHDARLRVTGLFSTSVVHGVRFCEPNKLTSAITAAPCTLTAEHVGQLASRVR